MATAPVMQRDPRFPGRSGPAVEKGSASDDSPLPVPRPPASFVGRTALLARLALHLAGEGDARRRVALYGEPGAGKSALAARLAGELALLFGGGTLWLDMTAPDGKTGIVAQVENLARLPYAGSGDPEHRIALARVHLEERAKNRLLVILDDATDLAFVEWVTSALLPACPVLVTTADPQLASSFAPLVQPVEALPDGDALHLLNAMLGGAPSDAGGADAETAAAVLDATRRLPLPVQLAGGAARGSGGLLAVAHALRDTAVATRATAPLPVPLRRALAAAYAALPGELQWRFRMLGAFGPGAVDLAALGAVWGDEDAAGATDAARQLESRGLLTPFCDNYYPHPTVRAFAAELLAAAPEIPRVRQRHAWHYLETAQQAEADFAAGDSTGLHVFGTVWPQLLTAQSALSSQEDAQAQHWRNLLGGTLPTLLAAHLPLPERLALVQRGLAAAQVSGQERWVIRHLAALAEANASAGAGCLMPPSCGSAGSRSLAGLTISARRRICSPGLRRVGPQWGRTGCARTFCGGTCATPRSGRPRGGD
jgi:hypothetical protein